MTKTPNHKKNLIAKESPQGSNIIALPIPLIDLAGVIYI